MIDSFKSVQKHTKFSYRREKDKIFLRPTLSERLGQIKIPIIIPGGENTMAFLDQIRVTSNAFHQEHIATYLKDKQMSALQINYLLAN